MIPKISGTPRAETPPSHFLRAPTSTDQSCYQSSVTTLQMRSLYSWIPALFNQIWWAIKSLFCCFRYPIHHHTEFKPEVNPEILSSSDPFYKTLFDSDHTLRNTKVFKLSCEIFDILGEGGIYRWGYHIKTINAKKDEILDYDVHPLESLYFLFHSESMSKLVCYFLDNATFGIGARFFKECAAKFKAYSGPIKPQIPGFCKLLSLDETHVKKLVNENKWQELIQYVHQTREKHFNL